MSATLRKKDGDDGKPGNRSLCSGKRRRAVDHPPGIPPFRNGRMSRNGLASVYVSDF